MPEGDTLHRLATTLCAEIGDAILGACWLRDRGEVPALRGARVSEVRALGKHLLIRMTPPPGGHAEEAVLHTHLGMPGRWHRPAEGARWREREVPAVRLSFEDGRPEWRCTRPATCELFPRKALRAHPVLRALGPDLCVAGAPTAAVLRRARRARSETIADLLLDQRVACGLGNVYKCELLFLHRLHPGTPVREVPDETLAALYRDGASLLQRNLGPGRRRTRGFDARGPTPRYWVYDRAGQPCARCRAPLSCERQGEGARVTYWCPRCQVRPGRELGDAERRHALRPGVARGTDREPNAPGPARPHSGRPR